ncbi:protein-export chaperone SecB [Ferriphaselus sp. R-1]|jgi:preprotein translocase subunit SecB|uniref:protein-export chaperone SecB n=1 Tax=Ferriphaselus sp. R-1 TaxID=1485544 RepID=UPI000554BEE1|nr:protein-export chaperone SecB [Ferriphaselus sp. R-1]
MSMTEATNQEQAPLFSIEKLYVKDLSLEVPHAPAIYLERVNPQIDLQLHSQAKQLEEGAFEVTITVTVTASIPEQENKVMFLIEATQGGVFQIRNVPAENIDPLLAVMCPNMLYPYLREVVSDASVRAGFAPVLLNPVNFESLYLQQKEQQAQQEAASATTH